MGGPIDLCVVKLIIMSADGVGSSYKGGLRALLYLHHMHQQRLASMRF